MSEFRFADLQFVHALWAVLAFVALLFFLDRRMTHVLDRFVSLAMQARLILRPSNFRSTARLACLGLAGVCLVLALMRPQWGLHFVQTPRASAEIMVCLDVSRSMLAEDVVPNRLDRAKSEVRDLLRYLDGDHVGLIAFAGRAAVLCPMTPDFSFLRMILDEANPGSVTRGGTHLAAPLEKALAGFGDTTDVSRTILLITDGEDHGSYPVEAAKKVAERGIKIIAVGFGDEAGSEIQFLDDKGARVTVRDDDGNPVISRLDGETLRQMVTATEGAYVPAGTAALDLESIYEIHIAPLTRGRLDGRGRAIRKEAFQWAVLAGLAFLLASAALHGRGRRRTRPLGSALGVALMGMVVGILLMGITLGPAPALAQDPPPSDPPGATEATSVDSDPDSDPEAEPEPEIPEDAREAYNAGVVGLAAGELDRAETLLLAARRESAADADARFASTFNLGWVEVRRADATLEEKPEEALQSLHEAADWFRDAVRLRPEDENARRNLEIVLKRALALADALRQKEDADITARLEKLIEEQRALIAAAATLLQRAVAEGENAAETLRRDFRQVATEQRKILSESAKLSETAAMEVEGLRAKPEAERTPEDQIRGAQLEGVIQYLHSARERMGQARRQLRRRQGDRAYRRASLGLGELKRARDQLRDPLDFLRQLTSDAAELNRLTSQLASGADVPDTAPAWLTREHLEETQAGVTSRAEEIHGRLAAGVAQMEAEASAPEPPPEPAAEPPAEPDPERERFLAAVKEALPYLDETRKHFEGAGTRLGETANDVPGAIPEQQAALLALGKAQELFLDIKGLVEVVYRVERQVDALLNADEAVLEQQIGATLAELLPTLAELQRTNLVRTDRLERLITEKLDELPAAATPTPGAAPDPNAEAGDAERKRFEMAAQLLDAARTELQVALDNLGDAGATPPVEAKLNDARPAVTASLEHLQNLRRLFFSIVEHLRETAERQLTVNDETQTLVPLAESEPDQIPPRLGPLSARQGELSLISDEIAKALKEQAEAPAAPPGGPTPGGAPPPGADQQEQEMRQRFERASELVHSAHESMENALVDMQLGDPPPPTLPMETIRGHQDTALENLVEALKLLEPPQDDQEQQQDQQQQQQQQPQDEEQKKEGEPRDAAQLLQAVRDREAQRRREKQKAASSSEPVDKDW